MRTETIAGIEYQIGKLGPFEQLHVGRKLAPLLAHAIPSLAKLSGEGEKPNLEMLLFEAAAVPMAEVLSRMSKEDVEYIVNECLAVCQRHEKRGWAKVLNAGGGLQYMDIEVDTLVGLTQAVINVSLGRFFPTGQPESTAPASPDSSQSE